MREIETEAKVRRREKARERGETRSWTGVRSLGLLTGGQIASSMVTRVITLCTACGAIPSERTRERDRREREREG